MKRVLFLFISLCSALLTMVLSLPAISFAQTAGKIAVLYGSFQGAPISENRFQCTRRAIERGGWKVDYINVDTRTWQSGTDDAAWFAARYDAVICQIDGFASLVIASGFGTNFQNAAGTARVAYSPLGGRWSIPVYVLTHRVIPSTTGGNDSTSNLYMAGITSASPAGTFAKPSGTAWENWRYKQIARLKTDSDSLFCDPVQFGCRPATWSGVGSSAVASIAFVDSGIAGGTFATCTAGDTCVSVWNYSVRPYSPTTPRKSVTYILFNQDYNGGQCEGILLALQRIAIETNAKPARKIPITIVEHDSRPVTNTASRMANWKTLQDKLNAADMYRYQFNPMSPTAGEIAFYTPEIINKLNDGYRNGTTRWVPFSYVWTGGFYLTSDTTMYRQAYNEIIRVSVNRDTFGLDKIGFDKRMEVSAGGQTGVWLGKVLKDAGVEVIETTFNNENPAGWSFAAPGKPFYLSEYKIPGVGDSRTIFTRLTLPLTHATTFVPGTHAATSGDNEYIGSGWLVPLWRATGNVFSLYWHTGGVGGVCADDPYYQWLLGDVFVRHVRYFDRILEFDTFTNPRW